jgi:hypothetical protein
MGIDDISEGQMTLEIGLGNEYGDRAVRPLVNILFGPGAEVAGTNPATGATFSAGLGLTAPVAVGGDEIMCTYSPTRAELTAGDAHLFYFVLRAWNADRVLVVVRADSAELDGGRVERAAFVHRAGRLEFIAGRTG